MKLDADLKIRRYRTVKNTVIVFLHIFFRRRATVDDKQGVRASLRGLRAPRAGATDGGKAVARRAVRALCLFLVLVCLEQHPVFVEALGDVVFSTRGYIHFFAQRRVLFVSRWPRVRS